MFWIIDRPESGSSGAIYGEIHGGGKLLWQSTVCPSCGRFTVGEQLTDASLELHGTNLLDFVWVDSTEVFISVSLMNLLKRSGLSGFTFRTVKIVAWWRNDPTTGEVVDWLEREEEPQIYQLVILGKGGSILPQNQVQVLPVCAECGAADYEFLTEGILVDQSQWDNSDVFTLNEVGWVFITEKFLRYLVENHIQNYTAIPSDKFSIL
jgi:hypothetical protein